MAVAPCPSCGESARIPSVPLPDQSTLQCPWCGESRAADQWTDSLPPTVRVLDADGRELEIAAQGEVETSTTSTRDELANAPSNIDPNSAAHDQAFSEQTESELTEESSETQDAQTTDWNPTRPEPISMRGKQSEPSAGWDMTGEEKSYSPVKRDRNRQWMRRAIPTLIAVPVLAAIVIFTGADLGFFPFNGFLHKSNTAVAQDSDQPGGTSDTDDPNAYEVTSPPSGRILVDSDSHGSTDESDQDPSEPSLTAAELANQFRGNDDGPADEVPSDGGSQTAIRSLEAPSEIAAPFNSSFDNRVAAATPATRRSDSLTLPGLTSPAESPNATQTQEANESVNDTTEDPKEPDWLSNAIAEISKPDDDAIGEPLSVGSPTSRAGASDATEDAEETTADDEKEKEDLKNALLVFPHAPPRPSQGTASIDPLASQQDPPSRQTTPSDPETSLDVSDSQVENVVDETEDQRPMLPPAIKLIPPDATSDVEASASAPSSVAANPDLQDVPLPTLPDLPPDAPNDQRVERTPETTPPAELPTDEANTEPDDLTGKPSIAVPPVIVDTPDGESNDDSKTGTESPSSEPETDPSPILTPPIVPEENNPAEVETQDSERPTTDSQPSSPELPKNTAQEESPELIALCQDASSKLEKLVEKMQRGTDMPRDLAMTYQSIALVGAQPNLSTSRCVAELLEKLNAFDARDQLEGLATQWIAWPGRSTPGIFLVGTLRDGDSPVIELSSESKIPVRMADKLKLSFNRRVLVIGRVTDSDTTSTVELLAGVAENESARD